MTTQEFSNEFDTLIAANTRLTDFGFQDPIEFDEYEKSVFLTKAQEDLVTGYYTGYTQSGVAFENTEETKRALGALIKTQSISPEASYSGVKIISTSQVFTLPSDLWFILYESAQLVTSTDTCLSGKIIEVVPTTLDSFSRVKENPFKRASERRALRVETGALIAGSADKVELISKYTIDTYLVRYIRKVNPIIVANLTTEGLAIDGVSIVTECELNSALHRKILEGAVRLALASKGIQLQNNKQ